MRADIKSFLVAVCVSLLVGCGPSLEDAKKLGFESVDEMKSLQAQGFKNKSEYGESEAKKLGFSNFDEMKKAISQGFKNGNELAEAGKKAKDLGFDSVDEMIELNSKGFKTKYEFKISEEKRIEAERIAENQRRDRAEIASFGDKCSGGLNSDVWSFAFNKGRISNAQLIIGTTITFLNSSGFELNEKDLLGQKNKLIMAGIGSFQGNDIPACVEKIELKFTNRSRGERKTECFIQAYQDDAEFQMLRGISVFGCDEMDVKIKQWVDSKNIRKLTQYEREF